jgi:hypothetical protein
MTIKISDHVKGATTFRAPTVAAARELPPAVSGLLRRLNLVAPPAGQKLKILDVDNAMVKIGMMTAARLRAKAELAMAGVNSP